MSSGPARRRMWIKPVGEWPSPEQNDGFRQTGTLRVPVSSCKRGVVGRVYAKLYPERQVLFRTQGQMRYLRLPGWLQCSFSMALLAVAGWGGFATGYYLSFDGILDSRERQIAEARQTLVSRLSAKENEIAEARRAFAQSLAAKERQVAEVRRVQRAVVEEVDQYRDGLVTASNRLEESQSMLAALIAGREIPVAQDDIGELLSRWADDTKLRPEIRALRSSWRGVAGRAGDLQSGFGRLGDGIKTVLADKAAVTQDRDLLRDEIRRLEATVASLRVSQGEVLEQVTLATETTLIEVENLITMTGLGADQLLVRLKGGGKVLTRDEPHGQGGPFIEFAALPLEPDDPLVSKVTLLDQKMGRWADLQRVLRMLPLVSPVDNYRLTSGFGPRIDPMRKRKARHNGLDLANRTNTPILAPAPGNVVFTGWRGGHGRTVIIDHGLGVRTQYGHLKKILVKRGQRVEFRDKIALMGSSGRSTGTHLHYEVQLDERPINPMKFMKAGKYVFKGK